MRLKEYLEEAFFKKVIRKGKVKRKLMCPVGFKAVNGKCVKMDAKEKLNRSKSAKKTQMKLSRDQSKMDKINRKRQKSIKKLHKLMPTLSQKGGQLQGLLKSKGE